MGFFKFLKRDRKKELDELDLPPEPPSTGDFGGDLSELPEFPDFQEKISAPKGEMPGFDLIEQKELGKDGFQQLPGFPELEEKSEIMPASAQQPYELPMSMPEAAPAPKEALQEPKEMPSDAYPKMESGLFSHEKMASKERPGGKMAYIRIDRFKATLGNINTIRSDLRKSEETITKLEGINSAKDRSSGRVKVQLEDLQKKLIFIDKTLFKGD